MKKRYVIFILIVLLSLLVVWYKTPIKVDETYDGYIFSYENERIDQEVKIHIKGKVSRNLFSDNVFNGEITVGEFSMQVQSGIPGNLKMRFLGLKSKINNEPMMLWGTKTEQRYLETTGIVHITRDFKRIWGFSKEMRSKYGEENVLFAAPATSSSQAKEIILKSK